MSATFAYGERTVPLDPPVDFPQLIDNAEGWEEFKTFRRQLASAFQVNDFGVERLPNGTFIVFPLEKDPKPKAQLDDFHKFLASFEVFSEKSPKSAELFELLQDQKKKYAESKDFLKASKLGFMRLIAQMVVLRQEIATKQEFAPILKEKVIPLRAMGDLETSVALVSLQESIDFLVQQGLTLLGASRFYEDLLAHWAGIPQEEKKATDLQGAAPFWAAQQEKFVRFTHQIRDWPQFGSATAIKAPVAKDTLLWLGQEALTDTKTKFTERQLAIRNEYRKSFKEQQKHITATQSAASSENAKKRTFSQMSVPVAPSPTPKKSFNFFPRPLRAPRAIFTARSKNRQGPGRWRRAVPKCKRCQKMGHTAQNCHSVK